MAATIGSRGTIFQLNTRLVKRRGSCGVLKSKLGMISVIYFLGVSGKEFFFDSHKNIILGFNYLYKDKKNINGDWRDEHRLEAHAIIKWNFGDLNFSDRNKYEYRMRGNKQNSRYRNSLLISKPISLHGVNFTPFIKNEIFYEFDTSKLNQNRFSFGASYKLGKRTRFELYYTLKSNRIDHDWDNTNIIGTKVKLDY